MRESDFRFWCASLQNTYYFLTRKTVPYDGYLVINSVDDFLRRLHAGEIMPRDAAQYLAHVSGDRKRYEDEVAHSVKMRIEDDKRKREREANALQKV